MYRLIVDHIEGFVIFLDCDVPAIYESMKFVKSEAYG